MANLFQITRYVFGLKMRADDLIRKPFSRLLLIELVKIKKTTRRA